MESKQQKYLPVLDWLRAIAISLVPLTHASYNELFNVNKIVAYADVFAHLSVPIFVFISGFLSLGATPQKIKERLPRILLPYLLMSIFCQVVKFRDDLIGNFWTIIYNILTADSFGIYYFVFVIVYLYLFAIILSKYQKHLGKFLLITLFISIPFFIYSAIPSQNLYQISRELYYRFPLNWLIFFIAGMWFKANDIFLKLQQFKIHFALAFLASLTLLVIAGELGFWVVYGSIFWFIFSSLGIVAIYLLFENVKVYPIIKYLSETSYSIYLLHIIPLAFLYYFISIPDSAIVAYSLPITLVLAVAVTIFSIIGREVTKYIFKDKSPYIIGS